MPTRYVLIGVVLLLFGCGAEEAAVPDAIGIEDQAKPESKSASVSTKDKKAPRWLLKIDGLPEISGRSIKAATMGANGQYSFARSGMVSSIRVLEGNPSSYMTFTFNDQNTRCSNQGSARLDISGKRAEISGTVECTPMVGDDEPVDASITGWFELKK